MIVLLGFHAGFYIISRRQFTCSSFIGVQTNTRLGYVPLTLTLYHGSRLGIEPGTPGSKSPTLTTRFLYDSIIFYRGRSPLTTFIKVSDMISITTDFLVAGKLDQ